MSHEVRRVPLGWKHPVEHNPYWRKQASTPYGRSKPASRLHGPFGLLTRMVLDEQRAG